MRADTPPSEYTSPDLAPPRPNRSLLQARVLRFIGSVELLAFAAVVMPRSAMESIHAALGLGHLPAGPVFESVMREVSFVYGFLGLSHLVIASDVHRYRPLVILSAIGFLLAAPLFFIIDHTLGMPLLWSAANLTSCLTIGSLLAFLLWTSDNSR